MPICRTCRGEYVREECLCLHCLQPLGRGVNLCHNCGAETRGKRLCPRCKSDVTAWEQEVSPLVEFIRRWGLLGLLPSLAALGMWIFFWWPKGSPLHHPLISIVGIALSQLVLIVLYITRLSWRERWWASQVYGTASLSLAAAITSSFVAGVALAISSFVVYKLWGRAPSVGQQAVFGAVYAPTYVCFTASLTLLAIHDYIDRLDQRVPPPIFVHTERLLRVAVETALKSVGVQAGRRAGEASAESDPNRRYEVLEVARIPQDGGVHVSLCVYQQVSLPEGIRVADGRKEKHWHIEADRWGRVRSVKPGPPGVG
jgi:hypothetical protein